ncbi:MAG: hypothetical protein AAF639_00935 [Chloroflexota bacterium]
MIKNITQSIHDNLIKPKPKPPFDDTSKFFYKDFFAKLKLEAETETNVYDKARSIDLVVICRQHNRAAIDDTVFQYFEYVNDLEFKGDNDPLTLQNYYLILSRAFALASQKEEERVLESRKKKSGAKKSGKQQPKKREKADRFLLRDMTLTIICVTRPDTLLNELADETKFTEVAPGLYYNDELIAKWIIHPSELMVIPENYPLLPLSRGETLEQFMDVCLREGLTEYLELILDLRLYTDSSTILKKILEAQMSNYQHWSDESLAVVDRFFEVFPEIKERVIARTVQQGVDQGFEKGREFGREEGLEQGLVQGLVRGKILDRQDTLLHLVKHKFKDIPTIVLTMIEDNQDIALLSAWTNIVLDSDDIEVIITEWEETLKDNFDNIIV